MQGGHKRGAGEAIIPVLDGAKKAAHDLGVLRYRSGIPSPGLLTHLVVASRLRACLFGRARKDRGLLDKGRWVRNIMSAEVCCGR